MSIKVAIVEDDSKIRESLKLILNGSQEYYCIAVYEDAESALHDLPNQNPDVVLMDINLPQMSGIECVNLLKQKYQRYL
ncbi:MAG: response regulator [Ignavibacteriaceae bacterium]|nr:response regulator [Ignavibacteriaceae bacterium]